MVEVNEAVVTAIKDRGSAMVSEDIVAMVERHHGDGPGVERDTVRAYAEALAAEPDYRLDVAALMAGVEERTTDDDTWVDEETLYELDGDTLSRYPAAWQDRLAGSRDVPKYVAFLGEERSPFERGATGEDEGVAKQPLLDAVATLGGVDRQTADDLFTDARERGVVVTDADQHPNARVYRPDDDRDRRDDLLQ